MYNVPMSKPSKGKKFVKMVKGKNGRKKKISYGAKGYKISPGTSKGNSYCARSYGIAKKHPNARKRNSPNALSRKKWKCKGKYSMKSLEGQSYINYMLEDGSVDQLVLGYPISLKSDMTFEGDDGCLYEYDSTLKSFHVNVIKEFEKYGGKDMWF